jgi:hypothetical protein
MRGAGRSPRGARPSVAHLPRTRRPESHSRGAPRGTRRYELLQQGVACREQLTKRALDRRRFVIARRVALADVTEVDELEAPSGSSRRVRSASRTREIVVGWAAAAKRAVPWVNEHPWLAAHALYRGAPPGVQISILKEEAPRSIPRSLESARARSPGASTLRNAAPSSSSSGLTAEGSRFTSNMHPEVSRCQARPSGPRRRARRRARGRTAIVRAAIARWLLTP